MCYKHNLEPIGMKSPSFSTDTKITAYIRSLNANIGLQCQAQGFPIPNFR